MPRRRTRRSTSGAGDPLAVEIAAWNSGDAYRTGALRTLIDAGLVERTRRGWQPTAEGRQRGLRTAHVDEPRRRGGRRMREDREPPRIRISYTRIVWIDPEDPNGYEEEHGWIDDEGVEFEPDELDIEEGMTPSESIVDQAVRFLQDEGAVNASANHFHIGVWYSTEFSVTDYGTGEEEERSFHLKDFSIEEAEAIYKEVAR